MPPKKPPKVVLESTVTQDITEMQLNRLREIAMNRMLTLEECKQLDLLNKNLLLALGHANTIIDVTNSIDTVATPALLDVAEGKTPTFREALESITDASKEEPESDS